MDSQPSSLLDPFLFGCVVHGEMGKLMHSLLPMVITILNGCNIPYYMV